MTATQTDKLTLTLTAGEWRRIMRLVQKLSTDPKQIGPEGSAFRFLGGVEAKVVGKTLGKLDSVPVAIEATGDGWDRLADILIVMAPNSLCVDFEMAHGVRDLLLEALKAARQGAPAHA